MSHGYDMPMHEDRELPQFTLRQIDLPDVEYWEVNGEYFLIMKVEMVGKRNMKNLNAPKSDRAKIKGDFQVKAIKPLDDTPVNLAMVEQADFEMVTARAKSGGK